jgi:hypothetical protein
MGKDCSRTTIQPSFQQDTALMAEERLRDKFQPNPLQRLNNAFVKLRAIFDTR